MSSIFCFFGRSIWIDDNMGTIANWSEGDGYKVGFGEVNGKILPAI